MISITCRACGAGLEIPEEYAGQTGRCVRCGEDVGVPGRIEADKQPGSGGNAHDNGDHSRPANGTRADPSVGCSPLWIAAGTVTCGLLLVDFVVPCLLQDPPARWIPEWILMGIVGGFYGLCAGQLLLIATAAVLGPGNILLRLSWSFLLGIAMWYTLVFVVNLSQCLTVSGTLLILRAFGLRLVRDKRALMNGRCV